MGKYTIEVCAMIEIITLGNFDIKYQNVSILHDIGNKHRLMKLFKYLLTFQGKKLLPEKIIEDLWEDEYAEPLNALRTQISRVRSMLSLEVFGEKPFFSITYIDGYYVLKLSDECFVDFLHLENCIKEVESGDSNNLYSNCRGIIGLYKGEFLGELGNEDWLIPVRRRFERLYIKHITKYLQHLLDKGKFNEIITICEEALIYEPYEELLHVYYMEALAAIGDNKSAISHYSYCTTLLYREFGESPSNKMRDIYKKIKNNNNNKLIHIETLMKQITNYTEREGAIICDIRQFEFILEYEKSLQDRENRDIFLGILTLDQIGLVENKECDLKVTTRHFMKFLQNNMRKGDILSKTNSNQLLVLFKTSDNCCINCVMERINNCFQELHCHKNMDLNIKFKKI